MNRVWKQSLAVVLALVLCLGMVSGTAAPAEAASYVYNWGKRGEVATELSTAASDFYSGSNTYENFSQMAGTSNRNDVPTTELYLALQQFMRDNHTHETTYNETKSLYKYTDCENGGGKISSFYSGTPIGPNWDGNWNREHTWPQSKGCPKGSTSGDDIMKLRPTATSENSSRGNTAYGESSGYYDPNEESNGAYNLRGDVARIMLYVYVRYGEADHLSHMWGKSGVLESVEVMFKWMEEDPVDTWELGRNDSVQSITGTRNVFVDYPELAYILFDRAIPSDLQTPSNLGANTSGSAGGSSGSSSGSTTTKPSTPAEIMAAAAQLSSGEGLDGNYTLSGTITTYEFVEKYGDANVTITVDGTDGQTIYCYGLEGEVTDLKVGDHITVTGEIQNYNGTIEFYLPTLDSVNAGGTTSGGTTSGGNTSGGNTSGGNTSGGNTSGGNTSGGNTSGGNTSGGNTSGGNTSGGNTSGSNTSGGNTSGSNTSGGDNSDTTDTPDAPVCTHTETELRNQLDASCSKDGYTGDSYCKACGEKLSDGQAIPAAHSPEKIAAVAPTLESDGSCAHYKCTVCRRLFKDAEAKELATLDDIRLERLKVDEKTDNTLVIVLTVVLVAAVLGAGAAVAIILIKKKKAQPAEPAEAPEQPAE